MLYINVDTGMQRYHVFKIQGFSLLKCVPKVWSSLKKEHLKEFQLSFSIIILFNKQITMIILPEMDKIFAMFVFYWTKYYTPYLFCSGF